MARKPLIPKSTPRVHLENELTAAAAAEKVTLRPVQSESVPVTAAPRYDESEFSTVVASVINLKKATREYGAELCDLCPPSSHVALLAKLEHVRENAELAIRSGGK